MLLQLAFLLFTVSLIHANCPIGTVYDPNFGRCYGYFSTPLPFLAAEKKCNSLGGNLVAPQNGFENSYVSGLISGASSVPKNTWIGANLLMSSSWAWTYNVPMTYTNWAVRNPSVGDCGLMSGADFTWVSVACSTALPFVCSLDPKEQNQDSCITKSTPRSTTSAKPTTQPATLYPPTDISKAGFDMIFVADSSDSFSPYEYEETLTPIRLAFENMTFNKSRIILAAYDQTPNFVVSNFNSIVDSNTYAMNWIDLTLIGYTGQSGNNIDDVLNYIINTTIPATPFRRDVRKVIVFISSLGWDRGGMNEMGYNNPAQNIDRLKEMNVEFIPIAYGGQANMFQLRQFSSKCLQLAQTVDEFNRISQYLVYNLAQNTMQCN